MKVVFLSLCVGFVAQANSLVGYWEMAGGQCDGRIHERFTGPAIHFLQDGNYTVHMMGQQTAAGTYTVQGNTVTLVEENRPYDYNIIFHNPNMMALVGGPQQCGFVFEKSSNPPGGQ